MISQGKRNHVSTLEIHLTDEEKAMAQKPWPGRINAIKAVRARTGLMLKDAKELVEQESPWNRISSEQSHLVNYVDPLRNERDRYRRALEAIAKIQGGVVNAARYAQDILDGKDGDAWWLR